MSQLFFLTIAKKNKTKMARVREDDRISPTGGSSKMPKVSSKASKIVFSSYKINEKANPNNLYVKLHYEFQKLLAVTGMAERKESGIQKRRRITLHSFRRHAKSVISNQVNQDYSEWFLGHSKSPYYTLKELERREIYATKCMKYLTFLDYTTLEATGKNIEAKLSEKEKEIQLLRQRKIL
jgi:hypothetical protein